MKIKELRELILNTYHSNGFMHRIRGNSSIIEQANDILMPLDQEKEVDNVVFSQVVALFAVALRRWSVGAKPSASLQILPIIINTVLEATNEQAPGLSLETIKLGFTDRDISALEFLSCYTTRLQTGEHENQKSNSSSSVSRPTVVFPANSRSLLSTVNSAYVTLTSSSLQSRDQSQSPLPATATHHNTRSLTTLRTTNSASEIIQRKIISAPKDIEWICSFPEGHLEEDIINTCDRLRQEGFQHVTYQKESYNRYDGIILATVRFSRAYSKDLGYNATMSKTGIFNNLVLPLKTTEEKLREFNNPNLSRWLQSDIEELYQISHNRSHSVFADRRGYIIKIDEETSYLIPFLYDPINGQLVTEVELQSNERLATAKTIRRATDEMGMLGDIMSRTDSTYGYNLYLTFLAHEDKNIRVIQPTAENQGKKALSNTTTSILTNLAQSDPLSTKRQPLSSSSVTTSVSSSPASLVSNRTTPHTNEASTLLASADTISQKADKRAQLEQQLKDLEERVSNIGAEVGRRGYACSDLVTESNELRAQIRDTENQLNPKSSSSSSGFFDSYSAYQKKMRENDSGYDDRMSARYG